MTIARTLVVTLFLTLSTNAHAASDRYYVDPSQTKTTTQIALKEKGNLNGKFTTATGAFFYDSEAKTISNIRLAVDATSLSASSKTTGSELDALFLPYDYPELTFTANGPYTFTNGKAEIKGTLALRGQKKETTFEGLLDNTSSSRQFVSLALRGTINRADYGMGTDGDAAADRYGDTLTLSFEMQGMRQ